MPRAWKTSRLETAPWKEPGMASLGCIFRGRIVTDWYYDSRIVVPEAWFNKQGRQINIYIYIYV